jgi:hypothetical protein
MKFVQKEVPFGLLILLNHLSETISISDSAKFIVDSNPDVVINDGNQEIFLSLHPIVKRVILF